MTRDGCLEIVGELAVKIVADEVVDGFGLIRATCSPPVEAAIAHDGTDAGIAEAEGYARLLSRSPAMLRLLRDALSFSAKRFDAQAEVSGADLLDWFMEWRERANATLSRVGAVSGGLATAAYPTGEADTEQDAAPPESLHWVALYRVALTWGDAAEGGWWFDAGELATDPALYAQLGVLPAAFLSDEAAQDHASRMARGLDALNEGRPPKHSALSRGVLEAHVLEAPSLPLHWPETAPRYA